MFLDNTCVSWFKREAHSGLQYCKAKVDDYMLLPLLKKTAGKYLSHPLLRYIDRLYGLSTYPNQTILIIHKQSQDMNPVNLHTGTRTSICVEKKLCLMSEGVH